MKKILTIILIIVTIGFAVVWKLTKKDTEIILPFTSGVSGQVLLGPTCPVMREPPDPACADKPYVTTVKVFAKNSGNTSPFAVMQTNKAGEYSFLLPPGEYTLEPFSGKPFPSCSSEDITIKPDVMSETNLSCDTGIR